MMAPQVDQRVFHRLIAEHFPTLSMHFESLCVDPAATPQCSSGRPLAVDIFSKALLKTVDSVEALCQLQATAPMMFDGSRLMTTACIGFQDISRESRIDGMASEHDMEAYKLRGGAVPGDAGQDSDFNRRNYSRNLSANTSRRATGEEAAQAGPACKRAKGLRPPQRRCREQRP
eukprot:jgi/Tetstr1/442964/TSEL_031026.t1